MADSFERIYPNIAYWVGYCGWIELGRDSYSGSFIRALDEGGMVWEGDARYETPDEALGALETALGEWLRRNAR